MTLEVLWGKLETDEQRLTMSKTRNSATRIMVNSLYYLGKIEHALETAETLRSRALEMLLTLKRGEASIALGLPMGAVPRLTGPLLMDDLRSFGARQRVAIIVFMRATDKDCPDLLVWVLGKGEVLLEVC